MDVAQLPQDYSHFEEAAYFYKLISASPVVHLSKGQAHKSIFYSN